jgi:hypothetical protein
MSRSIVAKNFSLHSLSPFSRGAEFLGPGENNIPEGGIGLAVGRTRGVETKQPIARNLQSDAADPRRARAPPSYISARAKSPGDRDHAIPSPRCADLLPKAVRHVESHRGRFICPVSQTFRGLV